jgi:hypothetical protein
VKQLDVVAGVGVDPATSYAVLDVFLSVALSRDSFPEVDELTCAGWSTTGVDPLAPPTPPRHPSRIPGRTATA